jgi:hypothetical protein
MKNGGAAPISTSSAQPEVLVSPTCRAYAGPADVCLGITEAGDHACFGIVEEHDPERDRVAG